MKKGLTRLYVNLSSILLIISGFAMLIWAYAADKEVILHAKDKGWLALSNVEDKFSYNELPAIICGIALIIIGFITNALTFIKWKNKNVSVFFIALAIIAFATILTGSLMMLLVDVKYPKTTDLSNVYHIKVIWITVIIWITGFLGIFSLSVAFFYVNKFTVRAVVDEVKKNPKSSDNALDLEVE